MKKLGGGVIEMKVEGREVWDGVEDGVEKFWEYDGDGSEEGLFVEEVSEESMRKG